jgi:hypothetical protein
MATRERPQGKPHQAIVSRAQPVTAKPIHIAILFNKNRPVRKPFRLSVERSLTVTAVHVATMHVLMTTPHGIHDVMAAAALDHRGPCFGPRGGGHRRR